VEKAVKPLKNSVQELTKVKHQHEELTPILVKNKSVWEELQDKIEEPVVKKHIPNYSIFEALQQKRDEYVIQNATIEFFIPEPAETVMLSRIKI
jgi:hypothetical protein